MVFGLLNIEKPAGPTSHDIVERVRRGTGERRVGHAGALDPLATGVLVLALGQATRLIEYLMASDKSYLATATLGISTDSYDAEGNITRERPIPSDLSQERVEVALQSFRGTIQQVPPVYSAIKVSGKSAHARVRAGETLAMPPRSVTLYSLDLVEFDPPRLMLAVKCSAGTYIRSLVHDLGEVFGCGAILSALVRTASGSFPLEEAVRWDTLNAAFEDGSWHNWLLPADRALEGRPQIKLDEAEQYRVLHGMSIASRTVIGGLARAYSPLGLFIAVLRGDLAAGLWRPIKVFHQTLDQTT